MTNALALVLVVLSAIWIVALARKEWIAVDRRYAADMRRILTKAIREMREHEADYRRRADSARHLGEPIRAAKWDGLADAAASYARKYEEELANA